MICPSTIRNGTEFAQSFATKVVNRWHCRKTILIGDASHVYPPFGGQGIASGVRDAHSLFWRLALLSRTSVAPVVQEKFLTSWGHEQRQACDHATKLTKINGSITNQRSTTLAFLTRVMMRLLWCIPGVPFLMSKMAIGDSFRYKHFNGLFALIDKRGGYKIPQIWIRRGDEKAQLSDEIFHRDVSRLALLTIVEDEDDVDEISMAKTTGRMNLPGELLGEESVTYLCLGSGKSTKGSQVYRPCGREELLAEGIEPVIGYNPHTLAKKIGSAAKYVIIRPDFFVHSVAVSVEELLDNGRTIVEYFS